MRELASGAGDPVSARDARPAWVGRRPRLTVRALLAGWTLATAGLLAAAVLLPGLRVDGIVGAFGVAALVGIMNALIVPAIARIRLPFTVLSGFLVVLALPAIQLRMVQPGVDTFPKSLPAVQAYDRMQQEFPGTALPASVVVKAPDVNAPAMQSAIQRLERLALASAAC